MPVTDLTLETQLLQRAPVQRVYLRRRWGVAWELQPHLFCTNMRTTIAPNVAMAQLHWLYGLVQQPTDAVPTEYPPLEILGWFVKIELDVLQPDGSTTTHRHYGLISEEDRERRGLLTQGSVSVLSGQQTFVAVGIEYLYRRQRIDRSLVEKVIGLQATIRRGLTFNDQNQNTNDRSRGNRSTGVAGGGHYVFAEDLSTSSFWSTRTAVEYLHRVFRPLGSSDFDFMDWQLDAPYMDLLPDGDKPRVESHGRTLGELFDELMNRRRGLGWMVFVDEEENRPYIRPLSLSSTAVAMPDAWTLLPAKNQFNLYSDSAVQQLSPVIKRSLLAQFDQVRVVGERVRSVFSVSAADGTLEADWTTDQRNAYNTGASGLGGYPTDRDEREAAHARVRNRPDLARVFACFRLPATDLNYVRDGIGGTLVPWLPSEVDAAIADTVYRPELRLQSYLPIEEHSDDGKKQYLRPLVVVRVATGPDRYLLIDQLGQLAKIEELGDGNGFKWSGHVRMAEHDAALWISTSGKPQHVLASDAADFSPVGDGSDDRDPPEINWREDLIATVCVEAPRHVEAVWPATATITDADSVRRLVIEIGDHGRLDYLAAGTVLGLEEDGSLVHQTGGVYLRDDRLRMRALARQAYVWYQRVRQAVQLRLAGIYLGLTEGDYIVSLGNADDPEPVEAVVSSLEFDLVNVSTTIHTDFAEIDFRRIV